MQTKHSQLAKAQQFQAMHFRKEMLLLPNIWDPLGALLLQNIGYPAVATASASIAFSNGYNDGEQIPFTELVWQVTKITDSVDIPVSVDIESGYSNSIDGIQKNIHKLIHAGIIGVNIEDTNKTNNSLVPIMIQCEKIQAIREVGARMGVPIFINTRTDVYLNDSPHITNVEKFKKLLKRAHAYKAAGADCIFPIGLKNKNEIEKFVNELSCPVNILMLPDVPDLITLQQIGVSRVSFGPSFLKVAIKALKDTALNIKNLANIDSITQNEIKTDYLKKLVIKKHKNEHHI